MTIVEYKNNKYQFKWRSIGLFLVSLLLVAGSLLILFELLWEYTFPPFMEPMSILLNWITGKDFSYYKMSHIYVFNVPGTSGIAFESACSGIHAYAIYLGISIGAPRNQLEYQKKKLWVRKLQTFVLSSVLVYIYNLFRIVITIYLYYKGVPFHPTHDYISYSLTFFAVFLYYIIAYYWLPEYPMLVIWAKEDLKRMIKERKSKKMEESGEQESKSKKNRKLVVIGTWIVISILLFVLMSLLLV